MDSKPQISARVQAFLERPPQVFIAGQWQATAGSLAIENPSTGETLAQVAAGGPEEIDRAAQAAQQAFDDRRWRGQSPAARTRVLWRIAELIDDQVDELAELEMLDTGKPLAAARHGEVPFAAECFRYYAGWCSKLSGDTLQPAGFPADAMHVYTRREAIGVAGLIVPSNGPLVQASWKLAPALAAGCCVILKPDEKTPLTALRLAELLAEAGVPDGVANVVTGTGEAAGAALVQHPLVAKISFTGSTETGKAVARAALGDLKRLTLELGGKSPMLVMADADLEQAIPGVAAAIFANAGQVCVAGSRLYVAAPVYEQVLAGVAELARKLRVGPGHEPATEMGPLISAGHLEYVQRMVAAGRQAGCELVTGGAALDLGGGHYFAPTVLAGARPGMPVVDEEIFGPVLTVARFDTLEEAVALANASRYGLAGSIWTRDIGLAHRLAGEIRAGLVWINCHGIPDMAVPFGGYRQSGWGRENGLEGLREYTELKTVMANIQAP